MFVFWRHVGGVRRGCSGLYMGWWLPQWHNVPRWLWTVFWFREMITVRYGGNWLLLMLDSVLSVSHFYGYKTKETVIKKCTTNSSPVSQQCILCMYIQLQWTTLLSIEHTPCAIKKCHCYFFDNFDKYCLIIVIFSLLYSARNCWIKVC